MVVFTCPPKLLLRILALPALAVPVRGAPGPHCPSYRSQPQGHRRSHDQHKFPSGLPRATVIANTPWRPWDLSAHCTSHLGPAHHRAWAPDPLSGRSKAEGARRVPLKVPGRYGAARPAHLRRWGRRRSPTTTAYCREPGGPPPPSWTPSARALGVGPSPCVDRRLCGLGLLCRGLSERWCCPRPRSLRGRRRGVVNVGWGCSWACCRPGTAGH